MNVNGRHYRTIWLNADGWAVEIIDQTRLPHVFETVTLRDACTMPPSPSATCWCAARR